MEETSVSVTNRHIVSAVHPGSGLHACHKALLLDAKEKKLAWPPAEEVNPQKFQEVTHHCNMPICFVGAFTRLVH